jgi:peptide/nickel transport system ATP-binding protein
MSTKHGKKGDILLEMKDIRIDGFSDERWHKIIKGIDLTLHRGEVMGLIGESGAGKSTLGLASMGFTKPGCKITSGSVIFDGQELVTASEDKKELFGVLELHMLHNQQLLHLTLHTDY